jgi:hypothetical protein
MLMFAENVAALLTDVTYFCSKEVRPKAWQPQDARYWAQHSAW